MFAGRSQKNTPMKTTDPKERIIELVLMTAVIKLFTISTAAKLIPIPMSQAITLMKSASMRN